MGWIPVLFARKALEMAAADRRDVVPSLRGGDQSDGMMRDTEFFDLLERIEREVAGGRSIPLRVGASMRCADYGAFGLAFKSAVDLRSSWRRVERYGRVVTSVSNFRLVPGERTSLLEVIPGLPTRRGLQLTNELALAAAMALSREVGRGSLEPVAVHLSLPAPDDPASFERHFGRSIGYEAGRDALEVADVDLSRPNRLGDDSISRFFDAHLDDAIAELPDGGALLRRVKSEISKVLSEGPPTVAETARRLAMSRRTLQRKLAEEGVGYRDLVAEVQHSLAKKLLRSSDCMLAEVAFLTGFADQSSFGRAFKRREGRTPGSFRRGALP